MYFAGVFDFGTYLDQQKFGILKWGKKCQAVNCSAEPTTSQKHQTFVNKPIGNQAVTFCQALAKCLGRTRGKWLPQAGRVYGKYLDKKNYEVETLGYRHLLALILEFLYLLEMSS